ncbi:MAG: TonB-dependent receptor [Verrucomicrobia bacterium]|nr:TonB-dependent receptor [Verrucomicrobiota bacterium]
MQLSSSLFAQSVVGRRLLGVFSLGAGLAGASFPSAAAESAVSEARVAQIRALSIEDLATVKVTSVSKRSEKLFESAAAVFVISGDDIRRSGARNFPEALRLSPGINVGQIDANKWAVASRGFNDRFTGKLLVLIDGRTVYTPMNGGVFWDVQDYLLEDIDRIEVIRGPGGTLWGANAVNGVINIITKSAAKSQGAYVSGGYGSEERGFAEGRYGLKLGETGFMRGYVKHHNHDDFGGGNDRWDFIQGGFRADWETLNDRITFQGDYYEGDIQHQQVIPSYVAPHLSVFDERFDVSGGNLLGRYEHQWSEESDLRFQAYYDRAERRETAFGNIQETFDLDFQHRFPLPLRQDLVYGLGYRFLPDEFFNRDPLWIRYEPASRNRQIFSGFVQDEIAMVEDHLRLTLGSKIEHNDFTGWEVQPNARLAWMLTDRQTVWAAVSRAVQVPARSANDIRVLLPVEPLPGGPFPLFLTGSGDAAVRSHTMLAYEAGYRIQPKDHLSLDLAAFYNDYDDFNIGRAGTPFFEPAPTPHLVLPFTTTSGGKGRGYGVEAATQWRLTDWWRLSGSYSFLKIELRDFPSGLEGEGKDPRHQATLRSAMDLPANLELDFWGRYVGELPIFGIDPYFDLDVRLAWQPHKNLELAIVGQNLIEARRFEFAPNEFDRTIGTAVQRGVYVQVTARF